MAGLHTIRTLKHSVRRFQPPQQECASVAPPARLLVEELGSEYVQYSFSSKLVFRCGARAAVNEIRQTDFFFRRFTVRR